MVVIITDYSPKYHSEVNRIFSEGIMSNVPSALSMSLTFYKFWILMVFTFLLGWIIHSWPFALLLVSCCIGMYSFTVYYCYRQYVRYVHLLIGQVGSDNNQESDVKKIFTFFMGLICTFFLDELREFTISDFPKQTHLGYTLITLFFPYTL